MALLAREEGERGTPPRAATASTITKNKPLNTTDKCAAKNVTTWVRELSCLDGRYHSPPYY